MSDIVKAEPREAAHAFEPSNLEEAYRLSKILIASKLLPRSVPTAEAAFAIIATGRELGLTALQSLRSIHVIEGKPTMSADLCLALVTNKPDKCAYFMLSESTEKVATYETHRRGHPKPTRMSFTWEDATRAGVVGKDNWRKYPAAMLRARCIMALARAVYPDCLLSVYDPDELNAPSNGHVPDAAPPALVVDPVDASGDPGPAGRQDNSDQSIDFLKAIQSAQTPEEMAIVQKSIRDAKLPDALVKPLRKAYKVREQQMVEADDCRDQELALDNPANES